MEKKFDMFADSEEEEVQADLVKDGFKIETANLDQEGYYLPKIGEVIRDKYKVTSIAGKGVFSCVVKASTEEREVAIKILRAKLPVVRASGEKEIEIVTDLNKTDPKDKKHCLRLIEKFEYNDHLCIVYESFHQNLRETLEEYGKDTGLSLDGVCRYAR